MSDRELQKYLFDLQGYLVIENVLTADEVSQLNSLIDQQKLLEPSQQLRFGAAAGAAPAAAGFLDWGKPFCNLLDHQAIMPILQFRLGDCFRLDRIYGIQMSSGMKRFHLHADYGATSPTSNSKPGEYYYFGVNEIHSGFVVVSWNLSDTGPAHGGFCCIPGSHKSNYRLPRPILTQHEKADCVVIPSAPAGSVTLFTEALTHGTSDWRGLHHRRTLLYKYCVAQMSWSSRRVQAPDNVELTARQQMILAEPADPHRFFPSLFDQSESSPL